MSSSSRVLSIRKQNEMKQPRSPTRRHTVYLFPIFILGLVLSGCRPPDEAPPGVPTPPESVQPPAPVETKVPAPSEDTKQAEQPEQAAGYGIEITSPASEYIYLSAVSVFGRITPPVGQNSLDPDLHLTWRILGTTRNGRPEVELDGGFEFEVDTAGLTDDLELFLVLFDSPEGRKLSEKKFRLNEGTRAPSIEITAPIAGSVYSSQVVLTGQVGDSTERIGSAEEIGYLYWTIPGSFRGGRIPFNRSGAFKTQVPTHGLTGDIVLKITASDFNRHISQNVQ